MEGELKIFELDGVKYFLVDTLSMVENTYYYFSNLLNNRDVLLLKDKGQEDQMMISVDDNEEFNYILSLFYDKFRNKIQDVA